ncbi:MAG TPA: 3-hydroxyacyl-CoA dehydrogenase family protein [Thermoanaerobaculia bacterium]|nr:3-hydroxyacyl-CoA dehydrogenase family protein [Thermoanaerobaculia bacterium]
MEIQNITVLGSGTMGRGIAYVGAVAGFDTTVTDVADEILESARNGVAELFSKAVEKGKMDRETAETAFERIRWISDLEVASREAHLIIEAVPEDLQLKKDLFSQVDLFCAEDTILASNTSSISITALAGAVERREKFIGLHFFNPVHAMKLIEIVIGERTSQKTIDVCRGVAERMKKEPILVRDTPGFATSRLGLALGLEAIRMLEDGVASVSDIDRAMELGYNHPMGPLRLTDLVGLDVRLDIADYLASRLGPRFEPPPLLRRLVEEGKLGKKSGQGFYPWPA